MLDNGFRSKCCYASIHVGTKKIKNTNIKVKIWICNKCHKRDVAITNYTKSVTRESSEEIDEEHIFAKDEG